MIFDELGSIILDDILINITEMQSVAFFRYLGIC